MHKNIIIVFFVVNNAFATGQFLFGSMGRLLPGDSDAAPLSTGSDFLKEIGCQSWDEYAQWDRLVGGNKEMFWLFNKRTAQLLGGGVTIDDCYFFDFCKQGVFVTKLSHNGLSLPFFVLNGASVKAVATVFKLCKIQGVMPDELRCHNKSLAEWLMLSRSLLATDSALLPYEKMHLDVWYQKIGSALAHVQARWDSLSDQEIWNEIMAVQSELDALFQPSDLRINRRPDSPCYQSNNQSNESATLLDDDDDLLSFD